MPSEPSAPARSTAPALVDTAAPPPPRGLGVGRLVTVNVLLGAVLVGLAWAGGAGGGQPDGSTGTGSGAGLGEGQPRSRGEYTIVSGKVQGSTASVLYILDAGNQELLVLGWDRSASRPEVTGFRSLADDGRYLRAPR